VYYTRVDVVAAAHQEVPGSMPYASLAGSGQSPQATHVKINADSILQRSYLLHAFLNAGILTPSSPQSLLSEWVPYPGVPSFVVTL
jgi:hypothetical protein